MKPFLSSLAAMPWAVEPLRLHAFFDELGRLQSSTAAASEGDDGETGEDPGPDVVDGIARITVSGMLMKSVPDWFSAYGIVATGYDRIAKAVAQAEGDSNVRGLLMIYDTPGGSTYGLQALADQLFATTKPQVAYASDLCASAGVFLASQADRVFASPGTTYGSIGTFMVAIDASRMAENAGVKVHVVSSGPQKGGAFGAAITQAQLDGMQAHIDALTTAFVDSVARGRGIPAAKVRESATGAVWLPGAAQQRGLIDGVCALPAAATAAATPIRTSARAVAARSSTTTAGATPATKGGAMALSASKLAELCKAHPSHQTKIVELFAVADAAGAQVHDEASITAAIAALDATELRASVAALTTEVATLKASAAAAATTHQASLATEQAAHAATKAELAKFAALGAAGKDPGADLTPPGTKSLPTFTREQARAGNVIPKALLDSGDYVIEG